MSLHLLTRALILSRLNSFKATLRFFTSSTRRWLTNLVKHPQCLAICPMLASLPQTWSLANHHKEPLSWKVLLWIYLAQRPRKLTALMILLNTNARAGVSARKLRIWNSPSKTLSIMSLQFFLLESRVFMSQVSRQLLTLMLWNWLKVSQFRLWCLLIGPYQRL